LVGRWRGCTMSRTRLSHMTYRRDYLPVLDRIEVALESSCDALMMLQSIDALTGTRADEPVAGGVATAISHLRRAIDELRDAQAQGQTGLALGFVLARDQADDASEEPKPGQSSPRRTA
jgi:hypothetical protein